MTPDYWNKATRHLSKQCPQMKVLIKRYKGESLRARGNGFYTLARSVVGQQISVKAADAIWKRIEQAVKPLTPKKLLALPEDKLRACGLSKPKAAYLRNVAEFFREREVDASYWANHTDEEIVTELVSIKGIGSWTAEMFMIFHLLRPDIFPVKDLAVLKAVDMHVTGKGRMKPAEYVALAQERWAPYRTVASWYLWRSLDPVPVEY